MSTNKIPGQPLFKTPWMWLAAFLGGLLLLTLANGVLRNRGDAETFPLTQWRTYAADPWQNPYWSLVKWRPIIEYSGDFRPIFEAAQGRMEDPAFRMYQPEQLKEGRAAFVYTPVVALALSPLCTPGTSFRRAARNLSYINHTMWLLSGLMLALMLVHARSGGPWVVALFVLHYLLYYPLAKALQLNQASVWIYTFLVTAGFLLQRGWISLSGLALAAAVSIKPHLVVIPALMFFAPGFPRRLVYFCAGGVAVAALISFVYAGWEQSMDYGLRTLPMLSAGYAYFPNQSINGLLLRLFTEHDPADFNLVPPYSWIKMVSSVFGLAILTLALWSCRVGGRTPGGLDPLLCFGLLVVAGTVASPVCWYHHLSALTVAYVVAVCTLARNPALRRRWLDGLLLVSLLLTGTFLDTRYLSGAPDAVLSAPGFYGTLMLLGAMCWMAQRDGTLRPR